MIFHFLVNLCFINVIILYYRQTAHYRILCGAVSFPKHAEDLEQFANLDTDWLARPAVNREVVSSILIGGVNTFFLAL